MTAETDGTLAGTDVAPQASAPTRAAATAPSAGGDPLVRVLVLTMVAIVVLTLVTVAYGLFSGVLGTGAPRTIAEHKILASRAKLEDGSKERQDWVDYIFALTDDGQYRLAQEYIDKGKKTLDKQEISADMLYMQANLFAAEERPDEALKIADTALKTIKTTHDKALKQRNETGKPTEASIGLHANYWDLLILKAEIHEKKGNYKSALAAYNEYLKEKRTAATVFVDRGEVKEKLKDKKGAEADFREALRFIPDNAAALAGLKRIGAKE